MAYEKSPFGDAGYTSGVTNVTSNVSNHYGPREVGGERGTYNTDGIVREYVIDFDNAQGPLYDTSPIPVGAVVLELVKVFATGAVTAATVGGTDISAAANTVATYVPITTAGTPVVTGPTAGKIIIRYMNVKK